MDNPNNPNSSTNPNPTSPFGGPLQTPSDLGNLPTTPPPGTQPTPTQPQSPAEPSPMPPPTPFPSPVPSWPPSSEPAITPSTEPNPIQSKPIPTPAPPPSWPQDTTQATPVPAPPALENVGPDLTSAWTPQATAQPESTQTSTQPTEPSPIQSEPTAYNPWSNPQLPMDPMSSQQSSIWTPPVQSEGGPVLQPQTPTQPEPDLPLATLTSAQSEPNPIQSEPTLPPSGTEPTSTFIPPVASSAVTSEPSSATLPLNNPGGTTPVNPTQPSWVIDTQTPGMPSSPTEPTEAAPTDLSHLISSNQQEPASIPVSENLVVPTAGVTPEVPNLSTAAHKGIPKWLIGLGLGLLIIVLGASAYFILGFGQPSKRTVSLPATTTSQTTQVKPPLPIATVSSQPSPSTATGSANFGQLGGTPPATSAADLIRQRQQGR